MISLSRISVFLWKSCFSNIFSTFVYIFLLRDVLNSINVLIKYLLKLRNLKNITYSHLFGIYADKISIHGSWIFEFLLAFHTSVNKLIKALKIYWEIISCSAFEKHLFSKKNVCSRSEIVSCFQKSLNHWLNNSTVEAQESSVSQKLSMRKS